MRLSLAALVALVALLGCASSQHRLPPLPGQGGPTWRVLQGPTFRLHTDLPETEAVRLFAELERLLATVLQVGWDVQRPTKLRFKVIVFERKQDFAHFNDSTVRGFFARPWATSPFAVFSAADGVAGRETLVHELTHQIAYSAMPDQPPWFSEGVATFFETTVIDGQGQAKVGLPSRPSYVLLNALGMLPPERLLSARANTRHPLFHPSAWLLVHYLMMKRSDAFAGYQTALARGVGHTAAWRRLFPELTTSQLRKELTEYLRAGTFDYVTAPAPQLEVRPTVRKMSDADVYALRGLLYLNCYRCGEGARLRGRDCIRQALALDPNHFEALLFSPVGDRSTAWEHAHRLVAHHPYRPEAWLALAYVLLESQQERSPEVAAAIDRALRLGQSEPRVVALAAGISAMNRDLPTALRLSSQAAASAPADHMVLSARRRVLWEAGECAEARRITERLALLRHGVVHGSPFARSSEHRCNERSDTRTEGRPVALKGGGARGNRGGRNRCVGTCGRRKNGGR